ncbi:MAG: nucleotidyltransferase family protein [Alphaproteobacteria bacterium]|nr:nucleotidyltransferase family protein [Alphaproteobacteria bacterium]
MLRRNDYARAVFDRATDIALPGWYLGAGCIAQSVWNDAFGFPLTRGILDLDFVYFDPDLTAATEERHQRDVRDLLADLPVKTEVKNQARVHLWYRDRFGYDIAAAHSLAEAAMTWPTTATAIVVRSGATGLDVLAPFGLADLFALVVRPNKRQITKEIYRQKVARWRSLWPGLTYVAWEEA